MDATFNPERRHNGGRLATGNQSHVASVAAVWSLSEQRERLCDSSETALAPRPEAVKLARELVADADYPPPELLQWLAAVLLRRLDDQPEEPSASEEHVP